MGMHVVKVPDIGEGIAEVELVLWHVEAGDTVVADQTLADVMTDKATVEVPSPVAGRVLALSGNAGDKLAVGSELLRIAVDEAAIAPPDPAAAAARVSTAATPIATAPVVTAPDAPAAAGKPLASPSVRRQARELSVDLAQVPGSGPDGRVLHEDVVRFAAPHAVATTGPVTPASAPRHGERNG